MIQSIKNFIIIHTITSLSLLIKVFQDLESNVATVVN